MTDDNPATTAALEAAMQTAIDGILPGLTLSDWVITATAFRWEELGQRTHMFYLPRPEQSLYLTRGLAVSGSDFWRHADKEDE